MSEDRLIHLPTRGLDLCYRLDGSGDGPVVVLVMGLGMQLVAWPQALVDGLLAQGCRVLRLDNRDIGRSGSGPLRSHTPVKRALLRYLLHLPFVPPYGIDDMAYDALALCDALNLPPVHLVGASLGGMIAQKAAVLAPQRVASIVSIMSSAGSRASPWPDWSVLPLFLTRPPSQASLARRVEHFRRLFERIGAIEEEDERQALEAQLTVAMNRAYRPAGTARQLLAVLADPDRSAEVRRISCPVTLIHGERDPLVRIAAAEHMARLLPQAHFQRIERFAHHLPTWSIPVLNEAIGAHLQRAGALNSLH